MLSSEVRDTPLESLSDRIDAAVNRGARSSLSLAQERVRTALVIGRVLATQTDYPARGWIQAIRTAMIALTWEKGCFSSADHVLWKWLHGRTQGSLPRHPLEHPAPCTRHECAECVECEMEALPFEEWEEGVGS